MADFIGFLFTLENTTQLSFFTGEMFWGGEGKKQIEEKQKKILTTHFMKITF